MLYLKLFDPWRSSLCTCPPKYSLNPYTGCGHRCLYCYATSFIKDFYFPRIKKNFLKIIESDFKKVPEGSLISLSNSSDPYQPLEKKYKFTRKFLEMLENTSYRVLIITKSNLILRDLDILKKIKCAVSITITSKKFCFLLEPGAPTYEERINTLKILSQEKIPTCVRLDPIIPGINEEEILEILEEVSQFVKHVIVSTYKAKPDSLNRLINAFPQYQELWRKLYLTEGQKIGRAIYLKDKTRYVLINRIYQKVRSYNLSFATCREALKDFENPQKCDGSFLINI